jgi:hypothetical protein
MVTRVPLKLKSEVQMMKNTMKQCVAVGWLLVAASSPVSAQDAYRLVFAQVVTRGERPSTLKLSATGPIAFRVLPPSETGAAATPQQVVARLYGVAPGELATSELAPFSVTTRVEGHDTILTVTTTGDVRLELRAGARSNEVEVVATVR